MVGDGGLFVGVISGKVIINFKSCRETKGLKWRGLAEWGDLAMSCTSVIFLVRLELSQGFNWNPDFKETLGPSSKPPTSPFSIPAPPLLLTPLAGWIRSHSQHIHTEHDHYNIRQSITMHDLGWNWLCSYLHRTFGCGALICVAFVCASK